VVASCVAAVGGLASHRLGTGPVTDPLPSPGQLRRRPWVAPVCGLPVQREGAGTVPGPLPKVGQLPQAPGVAARPTPV